MTEQPDKPTITTSPSRPGEALIHLPDFTYFDSQVWSADVGIPEAALRDLRDAITRHLNADQEPGDHFHQARLDVEHIVERQGGVDSWVIVRILWQRFRNLPTDTEPGPAVEQVRDRIASEYRRRRARYDSGGLPRHARHQVSGELMGLLGAIGMTLGEHIPGGDADIAGRDWYQQWLTRQEAPTDRTEANGTS